MPMWPSSSNHPSLGVADAVARNRRRRGGFRRALLVGALCVALVGPGALGVDGLLTARREMRNVRVELNNFWVAMSGYNVDTARVALASAEQHLGRAWDAGTAFPLPLLKWIPLVGSPVRALESGHRAAKEIIGAGWIVADAAGELPASVAAGDHSLSRVHGAAVHSEAEVEQAALRLAAAGLALQGPVGAFLPPISERAQRMLDKVGRAETQFDEARGGLNILAGLTAPGVDARLLVVALDSTELRPTGGDIGSFGVVHIHDGKADLERYAASDSLPLPDPPMTPPAEMVPVLTARGWELTNANWWPDFPTSAANVAEMFRRQGGGKVDGVVALTDQVIARILEVLGPIRLPSYAEPVTAEGFAKRALYEIELKRPSDNPRKKFLIELSAEVFKRLSHLPSGDAPKVLGALHQAASAGEVQVWFSRPEWQSVIAGTEFSGALPATSPSRDFLMLVESNMVNSRANAELVRAARYTVTRHDDSHLAAHLEITYRNQGERSSINPGYFGLLHLYVPKGAELIGGGRAQDAEDGPYGFFTRSLEVPPKGELKVTFDYLLPASVGQAGTYEMTWLRQSGTPKDSLVVIVGDKRFEANPAQRQFEIAATAP
jgi:hypothetical protein